MKLMKWLSLLRLLILIAVLGSGTVIGAFSGQKHFTPLSNIVYKDDDEDEGEDDEDEDEDEDEDDEEEDDDKDDKKDPKV